MHIRIWAAIGGAALAWGTTGVATREALMQDVPPVAMVAVRAILASILLYAVLVARGHRFSRDRATWKLGLVAGVFQLSAPFVLFTLAYQYASAGFVGLLVALVPLATALIAHWLLPDERLHLAKIGGLAVGFGGVALLLLSGDSGLEEGGQPLLAAVLSIGAVLSIAFASVVAKGWPGSYDPIELSWMQFSVGVVLIGATMLLTEGMPENFSLYGWALVVYLTVIGSVAPFLLFYWVLRHVSSTKASLVGYLVPPVALVAGIVLLDEKLQAGIGVGGLMILIGVVLTDRAERRGTRRVETALGPP
jgi:drug/metabolite transporter (DMT)-like permease